MPNARQYWFRANDYAGWTQPLTWQGWVVLVAFCLLMVVGALFVLPNFGPSIFLPYLILLIGVFGGVCWLTGEPPRWRWRKR